MRRRRVLKGGRVESVGDLLRLDVTVRDLAPGGAGIRFGDLAMLPARFELTLVGDASPRACVRVWTRGLDAGVRFV